MSRLIAAHAYADCPGYKVSSKSADFPISYNADFKIYGYDVVSNAILAELDYTVTISKSALNDAKPDQPDQGDKEGAEVSGLVRSGGVPVRFERSETGTAA